jgi:hypothetical protein
VTHYLHLISLVSSSSRGGGGGPASRQTGGGIRVFMLSLTRLTPLAVPSHYTLQRTRHKVPNSTG